MKKPIYACFIPFLVALSAAMPAQNAKASGQTTTVPEIPNAVSVCSETCVIVAISTTPNPVVAQFGVGANNWCATAVTLTLPLTVSYGTPNTLLCATDPESGVQKAIAFQQQTTAYTVTWTATAGGTPTVTTIPALTPVAPTPVGAPFAATCQQFSDGSFQCTAASSTTLTTAPTT